jgi:hypothetical protein
MEPEDLAADIAPDAYKAIYDDDRTGDISLVHRTLGVLNTIESAHAWVVSALPVIYQTIPDGSDREISTLLKSAERQYACYLAFCRKPKYTRDNGRTKDRDRYLDLANDIMAKIQANILRIVPQDNPPEAKPYNAGGLVTYSGQRVMLPDQDGTTNSGDF